MTDDTREFLAADPKWTCGRWVLLFQSSGGAGVWRTSYSSERAVMSAARDAAEANPGTVFTIAQIGVSAKQVAPALMEWK